MIHGRDLFCETSFTSFVFKIANSKVYCICRELVLPTARYRLDKMHECSSWSRTLVFE